MNNILQLSLYLVHYLQHSQRHRWLVSYNKGYTIYYIYCLSLTLYLSKETFLFHRSRFPCIYCFKKVNILISCVAMPSGPRPVGRYDGPGLGSQCRDHGRAGGCHREVTRIVSMRRSRRFVYTEERMSGYYEEQKNLLVNRTNLLSTTVRTLNKGRTAVLKGRIIVFKSRTVVVKGRT